MDKVWVMMWMTEEDYGIGGVYSTREAAIEDTTRAFFEENEVVEDREDTGAKTVLWTNYGTFLIELHRMQ